MILKAFIHKYFFIKIVGVNQTVLRVVSFQFYSAVCKAVKSSCVASH